MESGTKNLNVKRVKSFNFEHVDNELYSWFCSQVSGTPGLSGTILMEKARQLAIQSGATQEHAASIDMNWINRFKSRRNIVAKVLHGEAATANPQHVSNWKENVLSLIRTQFADADIYNLDETESENCNSP